MDIKKEQETLLSTSYEKKANLTGNIKKYISSIIMILSIIIFSLKDGLKFATVDFKNKAIVIGITFGITYFFSVYTCLYMKSLGKNIAKQSDTFKNSVRRYAELKNKLSEKGISYLLPYFAQRETKQAIIRIKTEIIENATLVYKLYAKRYYDDKLETLTDKQKQAIKEADNLNITPLTSEELLNENQSDNKYKNPFNFGMKESKYDKTKTTGIMLKKAIVPLLFSPVTASFILSTNIIYSVFQTIIILLCSISYLTGAEEYVLMELKERYIEKADLLDKFISMYEMDHNVFADEEEKMKYYLNDCDENKAKLNTNVVYAQPCIDIFKNEASA